DNGDGSRGCGAAAGNVLINLRRPAAKQDRPEDILRRTPAARVARIELIRAGTGGIDMAGHAQLANVVLRDDAGPAASWDLLFRRNLDHRSEEHTSELQSRENLVCRLLLEKKN